MTRDEFGSDAYRRGWWVSTTLADALRAAAEKTPERVLVVDDGVRLDCATVNRQARSLAAALSTRMRPGGVVSFMLPNWHEAAVVYLGATLAGMIVNPILPSLRDRELTFILDDVDSRIIFVPAEFRGHDYAAMLGRVTAQLTSPPEVVVLRGAGHTPYSDLIDGAAPTDLPELDPDDVRMILYTSGTTGRPKGVLHSHNSLNALICQLRDHWMIDPGDKFLVPSPIAHIGGSIYAFECPLLLGTTAVLMDRWDADDAVALMTAERCTHMAGATPFLTQLLAAARRAGTRLPALKVFICGGASVPPSLIRSATEYFDHAVVSRVYGSTEVPVTTVGAATPGDTDHAADTDGRRGIADIRLVDGEIRARGAQMLLGYLHDGKPAEAFDGEGYFRTGDLGTWVDGDYLVVTGRAKDIIIRNGENIAPKEIEDILVAAPGIAEIAIVGLPDARTGERACAVIVPAAGTTPGLAELRGILSGAGVAMFKVPEQVEIWDALPKNDAGKVLKHQIRAALMEGEICRKQAQPE
ncbi:AMP-binding protein [Mycobacterium sp. CVI_P3]|uniref:AMP-binding protein n=1 Tax=Mycobacterium pinniadriaticum TaxID=2994102 RepID=A0ABT3S9K8_9MYCO|nr:AMP-binding protein [Mycobacterium pinniadriaticum]MCX2929746.1 AMP-binding protein [Mycobacterium pinniadriaticum]MCX2936170.1 AMP-binding protein [Mycobacterium pinniadriaticum]